MRSLPLVLYQSILAIFLGLASLNVLAKEWAFDVYLDKTKIGEHVFKLSDDKTLSSHAKFNVKLLFINAYQYEHQALEAWDNDCIKSLEANTVENKIKTVVKGKRKGDFFEVSSGKDTQKLLACTMTFAYWNPKILGKTQLLNPQNAEFLDVSFKKIGTPILEVKGKPTETTHYKLNASLHGKPKLNIELWYSGEEQEWVGLKSVTPEGYNINYQLKD